MIEFGRLALRERLRALRFLRIATRYTPDNPHDFTHVPDFARALVSLIDAPDDAYGQLMSEFDVKEFERFLPAPG